MGNVTAAHVTVDLECVRCGYNLRTLAWSGRCPECARAVADSALPTGFTFASRRRAQRAIRGVHVLVVSILLQVLIVIQLTAVMRCCLLLPKWVVLASVRIWGSGDFVVRAVELVAIALIVWRPTVRSGRVAGVVGWAALGAGAMGLLCDTSAALWWSPFTTGLAAHLMFVGMAWFPLISLLALYLYLWLSIDRRAHARLWVVASMSLLVLLSILYDGTLGGSYLGIEPNSGFAAPGASPWMRALSSACWIVILVGCWYYVRTLSAALRDAKALFVSVR